MVQIIRILFASSALYLLQKIVQRFSLFFGLIVLMIILFFAKGYLNNSFPVNLFYDFTTNTQENTQEDIVREVTIEKGDTLGAILRQQDLPNSDIRELIKLAQAEKITANLKIGQILIFNYDIELVENAVSDLNEEKLILNRMALKIDKIKSIEFVRQDDKFVIHHISAPLKKLVTQYEAIIDSSVIASLQKAGMSTNSIIKLINTYSHQIDFQRQIRPGDKITVVTEKFVTSQNEFSHHGQILHASLQTRGQEHNIYSYSPDGNPDSVQFFSEDGSSIKGNLLRTPVKVARVSSHFGYRKKHPVLGYGAMHKGVDFAAAVGTPIYAAGNGVVKFIGWKSGYGRFVLIQHNRRLSTAYAHASKFAKNLKHGSKVKQGDIIAYVGRSGRVTGPHLHYEVRISGRQVNPMKFKSTPGIQLAGAKLAKFNKHKEQLKNLSHKLSGNIELAATDITEVKLF